MSCNTRLLPLDESSWTPTHDHPKVYPTMYRRSWRTPVASPRPWPATMASWLRLTRAADQCTDAPRPGNGEAAASDTPASPPPSISHCFSRTKRQHHRTHCAATHPARCRLARRQACASAQQTASRRVIVCPALWTDFPASLNSARIISISQPGSDAMVLDNLCSQQSDGLPNYSSPRISYRFSTPWRAQTPDLRSPRLPRTVCGTSRHPLSRGSVTPCATPLGGPRPSHLRGLYRLC